MDNRSSKPAKRKKKDSDFATIAYRVVQEATADEERPAEPEPTPEDRHAMAVTLGRAVAGTGFPPLK